MKHWHRKEATGVGNKKTLQLIKTIRRKSNVLLILVLRKREREREVMVLTDDVSICVFVMSPSEKKKERRKERAKVSTFGLASVCDVSTEEGNKRRE